MIELNDCDCGGKPFAPDGKGNYYSVTCEKCLSTTGAFVLAHDTLPQCSDAIINDVRQKWNDGLRHSEKAKIVKP